MTAFSTDREAPDAGGAFMLLGDRPQDAEHDPLNFDRLAEDLALLILASRASTPFTLGIEAAWGRGKSTLMGHLRTRLDREESITSVTFNAWTADDGGVLEGLVKTVLNALDDRVLSRALRNEQLISGLRLTASITGGLIGVGNIVDTLWDRVVSDPRARNELRGLVAQAVGSWRKKRPAVASDRSLCVFVDDLDRCSPEGVLEVFEAMKLYLDAPGLVFVVGYDQDIVSDLVLRKKGYSETIKGRDYLEKFIQIVYRIPRASPEQADALVDALLCASHTTELFGTTERTLVIERNECNPRRIKRFINGFVLAYGLDSRWRDFEPQSLIRVHLLHMYFEEFVRLLERPSPRDPIDEFLEYRLARDVLRRREPGPTARQQICDALVSHRLGIPTPDEDLNEDALLESLEDNVPVAFAPLADREDFASLVQSLRESADWMALRQALAEGILPEAQDPRTVPQEAVIETGLNGLKVLWVDDEPDSVAPHVATIAARGAQVVSVTDSDTATRELYSQHFDVLVSDIARGENENAGLDDLVSFSRLEILPSTVIFFTSRITPARKRTADSYGATLTTDSQELFRSIAGAALSRPADEFDSDRRSA